MQGCIKLGPSWHFLSFTASYNLALIFAIVSLLVLALLALNVEFHNQLHRLQ